MGKIILESGTIDFKPVGRMAGYGRCPSGCRTVCQRQNDIKFDMTKGEMDDFELNDYMPDYGTFRKKNSDTDSESR